jgi:hypothetical protein
LATQEASAATYLPAWPTDAIEFIEMAKWLAKRLQNFVDLLLLHARAPRFF